MGSAFAAAVGQVQLSPFPLQGSALLPLGTFLPPGPDFGIVLLLGLLTGFPSCDRILSPVPGRLQSDGGDRRTSLK